MPGPNRTPLTMFSDFTKLLSPQEPNGNRKESKPSWLEEFLHGARQKMQEELHGIRCCLIRIEDSLAKDPQTDLRSYLVRSDSTGAGTALDLELPIPSFDEAWTAELGMFVTTPGAANGVVQIYLDGKSDASFIWNATIGANGFFSSPLSALYIPAGTRRLIASFSGLAANTSCTARIQVKREPNQPKMKPETLNPGQS